MQAKPGTAGLCGCGRSPTGKCCGWHALTEEVYKAKKDEYDLAVYRAQVQKKRTGDIPNMAQAQALGKAHLSLILKNKNLHFRVTTV